jgi:hypothetical protein
MHRSARTIALWRSRGWPGGLDKTTAAGSGQASQNICEILDASQNICEANFAIMHRGRALRDGFATQAVARLHIHRSLIAPAQLIREHEALEEWTVDQPAPSRAIH